MKDLWVLQWFLVTEFICSDGVIEMKQTRYIKRILEYFGMHDSKPKATPSILGFDKFIDMESAPSEDPNLCGQIVGSLIYMMTGTRPDLCHIVTKLSQHMSKPTVATLRRLPTVQPIFGHLGNTSALINMSYFFST